MVSTPRSCTPPKVYFTCLVICIIFVLFFWIIIVLIFLLGHALIRIYGHYWLGFLYMHVPMMILIDTENDTCEVSIY